MPSHTVRPAGKRYPDGGYAGGADAPGWPVTCQGMRGTAATCFRMQCRLASALEAASPLGTSVNGSFRATLGSAVTAAARGGYWRARQAGAARATAGPDARTRRDSRCRARSRPQGLCAPGTAYGRVRRGTGLSGDPAATVSRFLLMGDVEQEWPDVDVPSCAGGLPFELAEQFAWVSMGSLQCLALAWGIQ
jgi:hypothetical protein